MKDQKIPQFKTNDPIIFFLSFMGIGLLPFAPGTFASLATLPILYLLGSYSVPIFFLIPLTLILLIASSYLADLCQKKYHLHDPSWIVIDEVLGMLTTWFFYPSAKLSHLILMFLLFRFFDIIKFWPASYFDKQVKHGAGVILDDIISGIFAGIIFLILQKFLPTLVN